MTLKVDTICITIVYFTITKFRFRNTFKRTFLVRMSDMVAFPPGEKASDGDRNELSVIESKWRGCGHAWDQPF